MYAAKNCLRLGWFFCKDHGNPTLLANYRQIALCNSFYQLINIIITSRIRGLTEKYAVLKSSQHGFRGSQSVQLVVQKERWLLKQAMKQDTKLIRVDLDFKNAFNSGGHSSLWKILEGFGVPDVSELRSIYEHSTMRIQVGSKSSAAIQLDTGTVQGSALSPSCSTSSSMPSCDSSTLLAFPIVYEVSLIGIIKPLPTISFFSSAQRTMPISAGYCEPIPGVEWPEDIH